MKKGSQSHADIVSRMIPIPVSTYQRQDVVKMLNVVIVPVGFGPAINYFFERMGIRSKQRCKFALNPIYRFFHLLLNKMSKTTTDITTNTIQYMTNFIARLNKKTKMSMNTGANKKVSTRTKHAIKKHPNLFPI